MLGPNYGAVCAMSIREDGVVVEGKAHTPLLRLLLDIVILGVLDCRIVFKLSEQRG